MVIETNHEYLSIRKRFPCHHRFGLALPLSEQCFNVKQAKPDLNVFLTRLEYCFISQNC